MNKKISRRKFIKNTAIGLGSVAAGSQFLSCSNSNKPDKKPNIILLVADQWRAQAFGYAGDPNVKTPNIDKLANESINFSNAISSCPVCSPYRGSLLTGQFPLTNGVFVNDVPLNNVTTGFGDLFKTNGYDTAYIGKWHVNNHGRKAYIPPERRLGFDFWQVLECTHDYLNSEYYDNDDKEKSLWDGYDVFAQTKSAQEYIRKHDNTKPICMILSWGPPHDPYDTAPEKYNAMYHPDTIEYRPNVTSEKGIGEATDRLAGYYAHCTALDASMGDLIKTIHDKGIEDNTILIFTSDHGDMLGSHFAGKKQQPYEESTRVPFLLRYPALFGKKSRIVNAPIDAPDILPTLLGLNNFNIPNAIEGYDYSDYLQGGKDPSDGVGFLACYHPFGAFQRNYGGREYRGVRTERYTYVCTLPSTKQVERSPYAYIEIPDGPWLLFDNLKDPYQLNNLVNKPEFSNLQKEMEQCLLKKLAERNDEFLQGETYVEKWGYKTKANGTMAVFD